MALYLASLPVPQHPCPCHSSVLICQHIVTLARQTWPALFCTAEVGRDASMVLSRLTIESSHTPSHPARQCDVTPCPCCPEGPAKTTCPGGRGNWAVGTGPRRPRVWLRRVATAERRAAPQRAPSGGCRSQDQRRAVRGGTEGEGVFALRSLPARAGQEAVSRFYGGRGARGRARRGQVSQRPAGPAGRSARATSSRR